MSKHSLVVAAHVQALVVAGISHHDVDLPSHDTVVSKSAGDIRANRYEHIAIGLGSVLRTHRVAGLRGRVRHEVVHRVGALVSWARQHARPQSLSRTCPKCGVTQDAM